MHLVLVSVSSEFYVRVIACSRVRGNLNVIWGLFPLLSPTYVPVVVEDNATFERGVMLRSCCSVVSLLQE